MKVLVLAIFGGGEWVFGLSDFTEKIVQISDLANILHRFVILLIQWIADLSNILAWIVDLACNLVRILDCDSPPPNILTSLI